jgi:hypothetical protein
MKVSNKLTALAYILLSIGLIKPIPFQSDICIPCIFLDFEKIRYYIQNCYSYINKYQELPNYSRLNRIKEGIFSLSSDFTNIYTSGFPVGLTLDHFTTCHLYSHFYGVNEREIEIENNFITHIKSICGDHSGVELHKIITKTVVDSRTRILRKLYEKMRVLIHF